MPLPHLRKGVGSLPRALSSPRLTDVLRLRLAPLPPSRPLRATPLSRARAPLLARSPARSRAARRSSRQHGAVLTPGGAGAGSSPTGTGWGSWPREPPVALPTRLLLPLPLFGMLGKTAPPKLPASTTGAPVASISRGRGTRSSAASRWLDSSCVFARSRSCRSWRICIACARSFLCRAAMLASAHLEPRAMATCPKVCEFNSAAGRTFSRGESTRGESSDCGSRERAAGIPPFTPNVPHVWAWRKCIDLVPLKKGHP